MDDDAVRALGRRAEELSTVVAPKVYYRPGAAPNRHNPPRPPGEGRQRAAVTRPSTTLGQRGIHELKADQRLKSSTPVIGIPSAAPQLARASEQAAWNCSHVEERGTRAAGTDLLSDATDALMAVVGGTSAAAQTETRMAIKRETLFQSPATGQVCCVEHAPLRISDAWTRNRWRWVTPRERDA